MKNWELEDVQKANEKNPEEFFIPSLKERSRQANGDIVRLHFLLQSPLENEPRAERMWVEIIKVSKFLGITKYAGVLTNECCYINDLKIGDEINFSPKNIAQTFIKKGSPYWIDSAEKMALVSKMCTEKDGVVRFMYREKADTDEDSGWRMFSGFEDENYTDDSKNIGLINIGYLVDKDASLIEPLKGSIGCAYEREGRGKPWVKIEDWIPETE